MEHRPLPPAWDELVRTAGAVRADSPLVRTTPDRDRQLRRALRPVVMTAAIITAAGLAVLHLAGTPGVASANGGEDSQLFSLTNGDRASNGVHSLVFSGTLENIGEGASYNCNGIHVNGRSDDMIQRNYFAHPILGCGQLVFSMMQAYGVRYRSAGENIGWEVRILEPSRLHQQRLHEQQRPPGQHPRRQLHGDGRRIRRERAGRDLDGVWSRAERLDVQRGIRPGGRVLSATAATPPTPETCPAQLSGSEGPRGCSGHHRSHANAGADAVAHRNSRGHPDRKPSPEPSRPTRGAVRGAVPQHDRIRSRSVPHLLKGPAP